MLRRDLVSGAPAGKTWAGRAVSGVFAVMMTFDAVAHLMKPAAVLDAFLKLGMPIRFSAGLGVLVLVCVLLYLVSGTAVLGAMLLTGYLGGAVAIHLRAQDGTFAPLFPVLIGVLMWAGLLLRRPQLRSSLWASA